VYFVNKVHNISANVASTISDINLDPLAFDRLHEGLWLFKFKSVTEDKDQRLLSSMFSKSWLLDFMLTSLLNYAMDYLHTLLRVQLT